MAARLTHTTSKVARETASCRRSSAIFRAQFARNVEVWLISAAMLRTYAFFATLLAIAPLGCANQKIEPQVASSAAQTHYAVDFPAHLQSTSNDYVNTEGEVRRTTAEFPKYPGQLKDPPWPLAVTIVNRADEAGR